MVYDVYVKCWPTHVPCEAAIRTRSLFKFSMDPWLLCSIISWNFSLIHHVWYFQIILLYLINNFVGFDLNVRLLMYKPSEAETRTPSGSGFSLDSGHWRDIYLFFWVISEHASAVHHVFFPKFNWCTVSHYLLPKIQFEHLASDINQARNQEGLFPGP